MCDDEIILVVINAVGVGKSNFKKQQLCFTQQRFWPLCQDVSVSRRFFTKNRQQPYSPVLLANILL